MSCPVCQGHDSYKCPCCGTHSHGIECPECHGTGKTPYLALNLATNEVEEVTFSDWLILPEDEDDALLLKASHCRFEEGGYECHNCGGVGRIPEED